MTLRTLLFLPIYVISSWITLPQNELDHTNPPDTFVVVLDAGHGGHDPGNLGNGYQEKNIALNIVLQAGKELSKEKDIKVVYTRKDDSFVDLFVRGEIANKANADLFVSIHCDSHSSDAHGAGTFVLGLHANEQNFEIAKKENSVIYLEDDYETRYSEYDINSPESIIGLTIMQEEFLEKSIELGKMMQTNFTKKLKRKDRRVKQAGFIVLHQTFMPSVLIETGFLTNKSEGSYLNSKKGQSEMGRAIAEAIMAYKEAIMPNEVVSYSEPDFAEAPSTPPPMNKPKKEVEVVTKQPVKKEVVVNKPVEKKEEPAIEKELNTATEIDIAAQESKSPPIEADTKLPEKTIEAPAKEVAQKEDTSKKTITIKQEVIAKKKETPPPTKANRSQVEFRVQIMASSKNIPLESENFKGLNNLSKEPYKNLYRYMYGKTNSFEQVKLFKANADAKGYTTSYIVAYKDGKRVAVNQTVVALDEE
ncbi:MAG: N-acetylmuramoyl-L-alanine amidase [Bacteroidia bacterium]|nr:N-acetylmuramoyl-L-alanine amidase [Bacteroidia bacterium]